MLITLVIIGVIAALTIPNLMQKYTEQATVKQVQKFYSNLSNAYSLAIKENGTVAEWGLSSQNPASANKIKNFLFKPYFKIAKDCGNDNTGKCITDEWYKNLKNENYNRYSANLWYKITLDDGSAVWYQVRDGWTSIFYDTNGIKGPNAWGKDLFSFSLIDGIVHPSGSPSFYSLYGLDTNSRAHTYCSPNSSILYNGTECAGWVIYKGNMDYLRKEINW